MATIGRRARELSSGGHTAMSAELTSLQVWRRRWRRLLQVFHEETRLLQPTLIVISGLAKLLPPFVGGRVKVRILRAAGVQIGHSILCDLPVMCGAGNIRRRLIIGTGVFINVGCVFDLSDRIVIEDDVSIGHQVLILTSSHEVGQGGQRAAEVFRSPVTIGAGAWIGSRTVILPGVTIGSGAVVAAGAVLTADVPPNAISGGVPARVRVELDELAPGA